MRLTRPLLFLPSLLRSTCAYTTLSNPSLLSLPTPGNDFNIHTGALLSPILIPRVPGTPGSTAVLQHLTNFFTTHLPSWTLSFQNSTSTTPTSGGREVPFRNLIATRDPPWARPEKGEVGRLALVAHYDSKLTPEGFIGATDSAAPCAMLLHVARSIDAALTRKWAAQEASLASGGAGAWELELDDTSSKGVQILLLDGEEAFADWSDTDSLYGARAMAAEWEGQAYMAGSTYANPISSIDLFVLLDLLGAPEPAVPSYFRTTHWAYKHMAALETRMRELNLFKSRGRGPFLPEAGKRDQDRWLGGLIGDDHLPFLARGVQVLHLIPSPFPSVWHRVEDDGEHLDAGTVEDWAMLTTGFVAEWMELEGFIAEEGGKGAGRVRDELLHGDG